MEAIVDQPLAHIARLHAILGLQLVGEHNLVQRLRLIRQLKRAFQLRANVIRIQHGILSRLP